MIEVNEKRIKILEEMAQRLYTEWFVKFNLPAEVLTKAGFPDGKVKMEIFLRGETVWLTQAKIAELFNVERSVVTKHLQNIFRESELDKNSTCAKIAQVQKEGNREITRNVEFYNLDAIVSVGYRVNSIQATL